MNVRRNSITDCADYTDEEDHRIHSLSSAQSVVQSLVDPLFSAPRRLRGESSFSRLESRPKLPSIAQNVTACHHYTKSVERTHRARRRGLLTVRTATG